MAKITLLLFVSSLWLSGCAMSPGMHLTEGDFEKQSGYDEVVPDVALIPITNKMIQAQYAPQTSQANSELSFYSAVSHYKIGPQDILNIIVWEHPELTIPTGGQRTAQEDGHRVSADGTIFYPYVGVVQVSGKTNDEVRTLLTRKLSKFIKSPQLDVRVVEFNSQKVLVSGAVVKPNNLPISDIPLTLADAVSLSGGPLETADLQNVIVSRENKKIHVNLIEYYYEGISSQNFLLQNDDVVYVPLNTNKKVYILGEVKKPGAMPLVNGRLNLAEVLAEGGIDQVAADPEKIFVLRQELGKPVAYHLDAALPNALILASAFNMQPLDIVFVSTADVTRWNRVLTQLLPTVQTLWTLDRINEPN